MKLILLIFAVIAAFMPQGAFAGSNAKAILNIGVYYTFEPKQYVKQTKAGKEEILALDDTAVFKNNIADLFAKTGTIVNSLLGQHGLVEIKAVFIEHLYVANPPLYRDGEIPLSVDIVKFWPIIDAIPDKPDADIYLTVFASDVVLITSKEKILVDGAADVLKGKNIAFADWLVPNNSIPAITLLHEIGHALGADHPDEKVCTEITYIMCPSSQYKKDVLAGEEYINAIRDFYLKKISAR